MLRSLARSLNLRKGEGRLLAALGSFLFLTVAAETLMSSARNGLFLDHFPAGLVPYVMIGAAVATAVASVAFSGIIEKMARRSIALRLMVVFSVVLVGSVLAFAVDVRSAFVIYLVVTAVEVLALTHAWDYMGDLLTGRQAKRLLPLAGVGASLAAVIAGLSVGPLAEALTTQGLLVVAAFLLLGSLGFLWMVPEPPRAEEEDPESVSGGAVAKFSRRASRGFRSLKGHRLLRLLALATVLLVVMSTLIDLQWKLAVQEEADGADIARIFGYMQAAIGLGAVGLQVLASRVLFPRLGISGANLIQAGSVTLLAGAFVLHPEFLVIAALHFLDQALGDAVEKPAQQISLIPFPPRTKNAAFTTLDGVLRPLAQAGGAALALFLLVSTPDGTIRWVTVGLGVASFVVLTGHRRRYLATLEQALSRHTVDLRELGAGRLSVDRGVLQVVDRFLEDDDPTVVVFTLSLLKDLPSGEIAHRAVPLLEHPVPEVRMEAAGVLGTLIEDHEEVHDRMVERLAVEKDPDVTGALLVGLASLGREAGETDLGPFIEHPEPAVRRAALTAMAEWQPEAVRHHLEKLLEQGGTRDREAALSVVGTLGYENFLPVVSEAVLDDRVRSSALSALASFGSSALPALDRLLGRKDLPVPVRRTLVTTLAGIDDPEARQMLLNLVDHDELGPAALTSLRRLRSSGDMAPLDPGALRRLLRAEVERSARYALVGSGVEAIDPAGDLIFVTKEMEELRIRHLHRVLAVLSLGYDADGIAKSENAIFSDDANRRSNALEYLEGLLAAEDVTLVVPLAEWERGDPLEPLTRLTMESQRARRAPLDVLAEDDRWWPRALSRYAASLNDDGEDDFMIPLIEKVMLLKGSELFRGFPGDELAGIAELATEQHADSGEVIFEQGDPGDAYYLVVRGAISIIRDGHELAVLGTREGFGEMAILDQETRSATARAKEHTTLLVLDRDSFDQLVERNPAIARGIYRVLTQRLRSTLARIAAGH